MRIRTLLAVLLCLICGFALIGCAGQTNATKDAPEKADPQVQEATDAEGSAMDSESAENTKAETADPTLLYQGHGSLRIVTAEGKTIYVDPFAGEGYDKPADLILVTHGHYDHNGLDKLQKRNADWEVITQTEALKGGEHQTFDLGYVKIEAVEAGYNENHDASECVGYLLTFGNGATLYVSGDTSETPQMAQLADRAIDYAFYCCDGVYNMGPEEAAQCAKLVGAKHDIPYHSAPADGGKLFDNAAAKKFDAPNALIVQPGEEIELVS